MEEEFKNLFKYYLTKFTNFFQKEYDSGEGNLLKAELNMLDKNKTIDTWVSLIRSNYPVEKINDFKYEIYDLNNVIAESKMSSSSHIHQVNLSQQDDTSSIFMKFYFVFYCLANGIKSDSYKISERKIN